jgi:hypothetical protein
LWRKDKWLPGCELGRAAAVTKSSFLKQISVLVGQQSRLDGGEGGRAEVGIGIELFSPFA